MIHFRNQSVKKKILYLTQTDILSDSRILKSMRSAYDSDYEPCGIGVALNEGSALDKNAKTLNINSIKLFSLKLNFLPKIIRHTLSLMEMIAKLTLKSIKYKPDLIHCNDTLVLPLGVLIKLFSGAKLIYDAHELESNRNGISKSLGFLTLATEKMLWRFIDGLIVVSPSIETWYHDNIGAKRSVVILNSPVLNANNTEKTLYLRTKFNIPDQRKIFLYIGILGYGRGIDLLLDTFKQLDCKSDIVFLGYGDYYNRIEEISKNHENIHIHQAVPHDHVVDVAKSADFGLCLIENVSLSDYYSLPNKLFEYTFAGIPILASNFPDIKSLVDKYNLGMYVDLNTDSISQTIKKISQENIEFNFTPSDLEDLSWNTQEKKLIALYKETLN